MMRRNGINRELDSGAKEKKLAKDIIKALKERFEASDNPIALAAFDPKTTYNDVYKNIFNTVKTGDPDYYGDVTVDEMMAELAKPTHVPWFQQAYNKYVEGQRFANQIPGTRTYSGLTLGTDISLTSSVIFRAEIYYQGRFLTSKMRNVGLEAPPVMYVPADEEDYYMLTEKLPKALAAHSAEAYLKGVRVPVRQDGDTFLDATEMQCCVRIWLTTLQDLELLMLLLLLLLLLLVSSPSCCYWSYSY